MRLLSDHRIVVNPLSDSQMLVILLFIVLFFFIFSVVIPGVIASMLIWMLALFGITTFGVTKVKGAAGQVGKTVFVEGVPAFNKAMFRGASYVHNRVKTGKSAPRWAVWLLISVFVVPFVSIGIIGTVMRVTRESSVDTEVHASGTASSSSMMIDAETGTTSDSSKPGAKVSTVASMGAPVSLEVRPEVAGRIRYKNELIDTKARLNVVGMTYSLEGVDSTVLVTTFDSSNDEGVVEGYLDGASRTGFPLDDVVLKQAGFTSTRAMNAFGGIWERNVGGSTVRTIRRSEKR